MDVKKTRRVIEQEDITYVAFDGTEFKSEGACLDYEKEVERKHVESEAQKLEIKELKNKFPLDINASGIDTEYTYKWFKINNENEFSLLQQAYRLNGFGKPNTYPQILCVEVDEVWNNSNFLYRLSDMKKNTISFWEDFGLVVEFKMLEKIDDVQRK